MDSATSSPKSLLRTKLTGRISKDEVCELCRMMKGNENDEMKATLYSLTHEQDMRVSVNALWIFTHLDEAAVWLYDKQNELVDRVLKETNVTRRRLLLSLLLRQPFEADSLRADFWIIAFQKSQPTQSRMPSGPSV